MNILITICARGGSKGIPGKNIKQICGKPLIHYSIDLANKLKLKLNATVALSTDNQEIKAVAHKLGISTAYNRPDFLATDTAGKIDAIKDLLLYEESLISDKYNFVLDLDVTSPLRTLKDIELALELMIANSEALTLFSVNNASRNPYFNMVEEDGNGFYTLVKTNADGSVLCRQEAPKVYDLNASFYLYRRYFFDTDLKSPITDKSLVYVMDHICFDLDHSVDFLFMEFLLENKKLDFEL
jgi:CMP-N,N'-diacetyllegionaminic acid synthase